MQSILDVVSLDATYRAEGYDSAVVKGNYSLEKEVCVAAGWVLVEMHIPVLTKTERIPSTECCVGLAGSLKED